MDAFKRYIVKSQNAILRKSIIRNGLGLTYGSCPTCKNKKKTSNTVQNSTKSV